MILNTEKLKEALTGKNKAFITRVAKRQEERYGNVDVFEAIISPYERMIEFCFGENWVKYYFKQGKIVDEVGIGQGHKYEPSIKNCVMELYNKCKPQFEQFEWA